jgi:hypothetical protein
MEYHFEPATLGRDITRLATELIFPPSNHILAGSVQKLFIHHTILGAAKRFEKAADEIKEAFEHKLLEPIPETTLLVTSGVTLKAKVNSGRESFDKDAFIKAVSEKFDISAQELHKMAEKTVKKSKPPVSLSTSYQGVEV